MDRIYTETNASRPGDVLFLPAAFFAFWTIAYQIVLVARWPVWIIIPVFLATGVSGSFFAARFLRERAAMPGHGYRFHQSHFLLVVLAAGSAITPLFLLRPNQDDVVYFHRALSQLSALSQPILTRQTSVDVDAAAFSPVHLATSHEMLLAFFGHFVGIDPLYCYQVV